MSNKTGTSMGGTLENAKRPGLIQANCKKCIHIRKNKINHKTFYCDYYKIDFPNKKKCARFYEIPKPLQKKERPKKMTKAERLKSYKEGLKDNTWR